MVFFLVWENVKHFRKKNDRQYLCSPNGEANPSTFLDAIYNMYIIYRFSLWIPNSMLLKKLFCRFSEIFPISNSFYFFAQIERKPPGVWLNLAETALVHLNFDALMSGTCVPTFLFCERPKTFFLRFTIVMLFWLISVEFRKKDAQKTFP